jgi:YD repeat-containing protein
VKDVSVPCTSTPSFPADAVSDTLTCYNSSMALGAAPSTGDVTQTSTSTSDNAGQLISTTDARSKTVSYTYDADGPKTAEYDTTGGAAENSGWVVVVLPSRSGRVAA